MDPSKEFDELFQRMKNIERSNEARRDSLHKLQDKVRRKKRNGTPIFIFIAMVAIASFLVLSLGKTEDPPTPLAAGVVEKDPIIGAIQAVLEHEFTGPDEEYLRIAEDIYKQQTDPSYGGYVGTDRLPDEAERITYLEDAYLSYFTKAGFDSFVRNTPAMAAHVFGLDYRLTISDITASQVENQNSPTAYGFTGQVKYEDKADVTTSFKISGVAIISDEGKIDMISISHGGLLDWIDEKLK